MVVYYRKIPKIFQRPFLRGLFLDVVIFGGGLFNKGFFTLLVWGAYINLEGLIHGGAYFWNFTVY